MSEKEKIQSTEAGSIKESDASIEMTRLMNESKKRYEEENRKVKVKIIANVKYGEAIHTIGEKIYILASEVKEFEALKLIKKVFIEKEENEEGE